MSAATAFCAMLAVAAATVTAPMLVTAHDLLSGLAL